MKEKEILSTAINNFQSVTGVVLNQLKKPANNEKADAYVSLRRGKEEFRFYVEIKNELREIHLSQVVEQFGQSKKDWLLVSQYIPKPIRKKLKSLGINYLEASGNCHIYRENIFFFINDQSVKEVRKSSNTSLWNSTGLKFLYAVIRQEDILNKPYREIAEQANVSIGTIGKYIKELENENFIVNTPQGIITKNKKELINKWVTLYHVVLRPKLLIGRFKPVDKHMWEGLGGVRRVDVDFVTDDGKWQKDVYWTGEMAGYLITSKLTPEIITAYTRLTKAELMKQLKLIPDENGKIEILNAFWPKRETQEQENKVKIASYLLVYADLLGNYDSRNREIAEQIKKEHLDDK